MSEKVHSLQYIPVGHSCSSAIKFLLLNFTKTDYFISITVKNLRKAVDDDKIFNSPQQWLSVRAYNKILWILDTYLHYCGSCC